jgi:hypothetical protein
MSNEVEQSVKVIPFTEKSVWHVWSQQFLARGYNKGSQELLLGMVSLPSKIDYDTIDLSTDEGTNVLRMKKANNSAYTDLIMSFSDIVNFGLVDMKILQGSYQKETRP